MELAEQGKITDRFSKAIELLGNEKLEVRLGAIYALERISNDSQKDHWAVMEILTAFVRENSHKIHTKQDADNKIYKQEDNPIKPREDIQAIMTVIGRRKWTETEIGGLNLVGVNLMGIRISNANLEKINFGGANLQYALVANTNLKRSFFHNANLSEATFGNVDFEGTHFFETNLNNAHFGLSFTGGNSSGSHYEYSKNIPLEQIISAKNFDKAFLTPELNIKLKEYFATHPDEKPKNWSIDKIDSDNE